MRQQGFSMGVKEEETPGYAEYVMSMGDGEKLNFSQHMITA